MKIAKELINDCNHEMLDENGKLSKVLFTQGEVEGMMLKFAKYHVEAALKEASKNATNTNTPQSGYRYLKDENNNTIGNPISVTSNKQEVNKDSILNAYPLDQIK